jgi:hypothetical protein
LQKTSVILTCALSFGAVGVSKASPPDSPDIVYIDGQPCNSACQSYMAWSRQNTPMSGQRQRLSPTTAAGEKSPKAAGRRATRIHEAQSNPATNDRTARQAVPTSTEVPKAKTKNSQPGDKAAATSDTAVAMIADPASTDGTATHSATRATFGEVRAAVAVAEQVTAAMAAPLEPKAKTDNTGRSDHPKSAPSSGTDLRTAVLMVRPQITSVSELAGQEVAVDGKLSAAASNRVRTAIAAAGAGEVQLAESRGKAVDRVISGEVPAAVLTLVSPEAAEMFPKIAGFGILRIPLSARSNTADKP